MQTRPPISPILVGRDDLLELAERRAVAARDGAGHLLFLAGEAGIGKSRLLGAVVRSAQRLGFDAGGAAAFPRDLELAGALLLDLGDQLTRSRKPGWAEAGSRLLERMAAVAEVAGDSHRQRRLLVIEVVDMIARLADAGPVVLGLEDLHWADALTLEVLGHLARRLKDEPMLVVGTYRSDELYPRVPMREWRSRLIAQRLAEETPLTRLDRSQTATMARLLLGGEVPAPQRLVDVLHRRSDGIPLHVEELLAAMGGLETGNGEAGDALPDTLADAILQRAALLPAPARRVLASASVIGRSFDLDLLCAVHGAARAAALSAHREALDLARRALRTAPAELPPRERAALLRTAATEEAATDDNAAAAARLEEARRVLSSAGDPVAAAELLPALVNARHLLGDGLQARAGMIQAELDALERAARPASGGTRGRLLAALSAAYMLDRRVDESIAYGRQAIELAHADGDLTTELHARATVAACLAIAGKVDEAWPMLADVVGVARRGRREAEAARAYRMIGTGASCLVEYDVAETWLREGIDYAERTEQWNHRHYMASHAAHVAWCIGDWDAAERLAEQSLADGRGGLTTTITALHVRGYLALGRGEHPRAAVVLGEARRLGEEMNELQRYSPALWGLAESALLDGRTLETVELSERGLAASLEYRDAMYLFPFLVTGTRARLIAGDPLAAERWVEEVTDALVDRSIPGSLPAIDHARGLLALASGATGKARDHLAAARDAWIERRRWWEGTWSTIDLARCLFRANRPVDAAELLGPALDEARRVAAAPVLAAAEELDARLRVRHPDEAPWAPLSAREFEVARLIADGLTNRQIAAELSIAPKTVAAHVEHILDRLGAASRRG